MRGQKKKKKKRKEKEKKETNKQKKFFKKMNKTLMAGPYPLIQQVQGLGNLHF